MSLHFVQNATNFNNFSSINYYFNFNIFFHLVGTNKFCNPVKHNLKYSWDILQKHPEWTGQWVWPNWAPYFAFYISLITSRTNGEGQDICTSWLLMESSWQSEDGENEPYLANAWTRKKLLCPVRACPMLNGAKRPCENRRLVNSFRDLLPGEMESKARIWSA